MASRSVATASGRTEPHGCSSRLQACKDTPSKRLRGYIVQRRVAPCVVADDCLACRPEEGTRRLLGRPRSSSACATQFVCNCTLQKKPVPRGNTNDGNSGDRHVITVMQRVPHRRTRGRVSFFPFFLSFFLSFFYSAGIRCFRRATLDSPLLLPPP